jgi:hypothetical protein
MRCKAMSPMTESFKSGLKGIIALDIDGIFADTFVRVLRQHQGHYPAALEQFIVDNPDMVGDQHSGQFRPFEIRGLQLDSIALITDLIIKGELGCILVSSWVRSPDTHSLLARLFQYFNPDFDPRYLIGQTSGMGGEGRETAFLAQVRTHFGQLPAKRLLVIDDSGEKHFPQLHPINALASGRCGFTMDDYIQAIRILELDEVGGWRDWAKEGHVPDRFPPEWQPPCYQQLWQQHITAPIKKAGGL